MLSLKKVYSDELLQIALLISLLRVNQDPFYENDIYSSANDLDFHNGTSWRSVSPAVLRTHYVHPKSLDSVLLNYERELFADLNSLGRFNNGNFRHPNVTAYLLNIERIGVPGGDQDSLSASLQNQSQLSASTQNQTEQSSDTEPASNQLDDELGLTQEDMDLIEALWKQDVDLGFSLEAASQKEDTIKKDCLEDEATTSIPPTGEEQFEKIKCIEKEDIKEEEIDHEDEDFWSGVDYTIDTETGEYVIKGEAGADSNSSCDLEDLSFPAFSEFLLDEALRLVDDETEGQNNTENVDRIQKSATDGDNNTNTSESDFDLFSEMIQTPQFHHPHHRAAFQSRMPFVRTVSMEQRWQDLANLLSLPSPGDGAAGLHHPFGPHHALHNYSHQHAHAAAAAAAAYGPDARSVLLHNATLTPPMGDLNSTVPYGGTIGNAVATSMNLTNSSEPMGETSSTPHYKLEPSNEMMYYPNNTSEFGSNQTDGFLSSILNDEDLQLMDMAMNEGMYTMRMLESNNAVSNLSMNGTTGAPNVSRTDMERLDTSSDSAVSSMGSERVPSLSDGEWCDAGSDSGHTSGEHYITDYQNKYRPFDYSYSNRQLADNARMPPVAQKKHQMYGKRYFQDQGANGTVPHPHTPIKYEYRDTGATSYNSPSQADGAARTKVPEMKYSCSLEFSHMARSPADHIQHNHTYHLPAENSGVMQRPVSRDKSKSRKTDEEHLTRDEKRARALNIPISVDDIINLPMDEFNERLSKYDLSEAQLSLIRDIRRRGKNKVAAQNCRKRKLDQILSLADEVKEMRDRKMRLMNDHEYAVNEVKRMKDKYQQLYRHVFQNLRDPDGNHYSPYQYSLQTTADGSILMVPRSTALNNQSEHKEPSQSQKD